MDAALGALEAFVRSGRAVDVVVAVLVIEAAVLLSWRRWTGKGPAPLDLVGTLVSGFALAFALRFALTGAGAGPIALCLMVSFAGHLHDLARRGPWR